MRQYLDGLAAEWDLLERVILVVLQSNKVADHMPKLVEVEPVDCVWDGPSEGGTTTKPPTGITVRTWAPGDLFVGILSSFVGLRSRIRRDADWIGWLTGTVTDFNRVYKRHRPPSTPNAERAGTGR